jgi:hypothetical protein
MKNKMQVMLFAMAAIVLFQGCPTGNSAYVGSWVFTLNAQDYGLQLKANGDAVAFEHSGGPLFLGELTWQTFDGDLIIQQVSGQFKWIFAAHLATNTSLFGARVEYQGASPGLFSVPLSGQKL